MYAGAQGQINIAKFPLSANLVWQLLAVNSKLVLGVIKVGNSNAMKLRIVHRVCVLRQLVCMCQEY